MISPAPEVADFKLTKSRAVRVADPRSAVASSQ